MIRSNLWVEAFHGLLYVLTRILPVYTVTRCTNPHDLYFCTALILDLPLTWSSLEFTGVQDATCCSAWGGSVLQKMKTSDANLLENSHVDKSAH